MSREIKFRAWLDYGDGNGEMLPNIQNHINGDWAFGHIVNGNVDNVSEPMQYTGLKDNDKIEVYESDVVEAFGGHTVGVIVMHNGSWMIKTNKDLESLFDAYDSCDLHVIGNIHQNHELLK